MSRMFQEKKKKSKKSASFYVEMPSSQLDIDDVEEMKAGAQFFQQAIESIASSGQAEVSAEPERDAWAACVRSMFASNSFLYID